jgi:hypothetical protein
VLGVDGEKAFYAYKYEPFGGFQRDKLGGKRAGRTSAQTVYAYVCSKQHANGMPPTPGPGSFQRGVLV